MTGNRGEEMGNYLMLRSPTRTEPDTNRSPGRPSIWSMLKCFDHCVKTTSVIHPSEHNVCIYIAKLFFIYTGSGTLCKTVVGKSSLFAKDCILFLCIFYTAPQLFRNLGCRKLACQGSLAGSYALCYSIFCQTYISLVYMCSLFL